MSGIPDRYRALGREAVALTRYFVVGGANTALSFVVFRTAFAVLQHLRYGAAMSQALSYAVGITVGFLAHRSVTFRVTHRSRSQLVRFVVLQLSSLVVSALLVQAGVERLHLSPTVVWVLVTGAMSFVNFLLQRTWVFATVDVVGGLAAAE